MTFWTAQKRYLRGTLLYEPYKLYELYKPVFEVFHRKYDSREGDNSTAKEKGPNDHGP